MNYITYDELTIDMTDIHMNVKDLSDLLKLNSHLIYYKLPDPQSRLPSKIEYISLYQFYIEYIEKYGNENDTFFNDHATNIIKNLLTSNNKQKWYVFGVLDVVKLEYYSTVKNNEIIPLFYNGIVFSITEMYFVDNKEFITPENYKNRYKLHNTRLTKFINNKIDMFEDFKKGINIIY